ASQVAIGRRTKSLTQCPAIKKRKAIECGLSSQPLSGARRLSRKALALQYMGLGATENRPLAVAQSDGCDNWPERAICLENPIGTIELMSCRRVVCGCARADAEFIRQRLVEYQGVVK